METGTNVAIRRARELSPAKRQELAAVMACDGEEHRRDEFVSWLAEEFATLDHQRRAYFVAEADGVVVGFVRLWHSPHIGEWVIDGIVVSPSHRRRGVAFALLSRALGLAAESGAASVVVHVRNDNAPAMALYDKAGFRRETTDYRNSYGQRRQGRGWQCRIEAPVRPERGA